MRAELWQERLDAVSTVLDEPLTYQEMAAKAGVSVSTIVNYRKILGSGLRRGKSHDEAIAACAAKGMTRREAAAEIGISYNTLCVYARRIGVDFGHAARLVDDPRADEMAELYRVGYTLQKIGEHFGISRERVRQIMSGRKGISAKDGGQHARSKRRQSALAAMKEAKALNRYGCTHQQIARVKKLGRKLMAQGESYGRTPLGAFAHQRQNAIRRSIGWTLTFWQWWTIWQESGHWEQRGRGRGYMMCRYDDAGSYEVGNVYICTGVHNGKFQPNNPYRLAHPEHEAFMAARRASSTPTAPQEKQA